MGNNSGNYYNGSTFSGLPPDVDSNPCSGMTALYVGDVGRIWSCTSGFWITVVMCETKTSVLSTWRTAQIESDDTKRQIEKRTTKMAAK